MRLRRGAVPTCLGTDRPRRGVLRSVGMAYATNGPRDWRTLPSKTAENSRRDRTRRDYVREMGGTPQCTLIGGGRTSLDRAAFFNSTLVRYLDFMDNFLAEGETCHPSDNFGALLSSAEYAKRGGREFLTALAVA